MTSTTLKLAELLRAKVKGGIIPVEHDRDPRERGVVGRRDIERIDVEAPARDHAGDARQYPELVLNEDGDGV
jgi:hypothetical protein